MKKLLLLMLPCILLALGCSGDKIEFVEENKSVFRLGPNGQTSFSNIYPQKPVTVGENTFYTKYGYGELIFYINGIPETFSIFSVPADEQIETYLNFNIEKESTSSLNFVLCSYKKENNGKFSLFKEDQQEAINIPLSISGKPKQHLIKISGKFEKYKQENFVVLGTDVADVVVNVDSMIKFIDEKSNEEKLLAKENSAYVIAYPQKTIKVKFSKQIRIGGGGKGANVRLEKIDTTIETSTLDSLNNIFTQAICKIEIANPNTKNYDCEIVFSDHMNGVVFFGENNQRYDAFNSDTLKYAQVSSKNDDSSTYSGKKLAYAIAYLLGVSVIENEIGKERENDKTLIHNLMDTTTDGTYLSFRQWNQLQIRNVE